MHNDKKKIFTIKGNTFQFSLPDCNKIITGICPIETKDDTIRCSCNEIKKE